VNDTTKRRYAIAGVILLCLPAVIGSLAFVLLDITQAFFEANEVIVTAMRRTVGPWVVECFMLAAYGPLLLVVAAPLAVWISRKAGWWSGPSRIVWLFVVLAIAAAARFHGVSIHQEIVP